MPKRKSDDSDLDNLAKKLKKISRKIKRRRRRHDSSDRDNPSSSRRNQHESETITVLDEDDVIDPEVNCSYWDYYMNHDQREVETETRPTAAVSSDVPIPGPAAAEQAASAPVAAARAVSYAAAPPATATSAPAAVTPAAATAAATAAASPLTSISPSPPAAPAQAAQPINEIMPDKDVPTLDSDLLEILGEDPTLVLEYGPEIQKDLAIRLNHIVTSGLSKENRKELKEKYKIPANCKLIKAPTLNPEISASLQESQAKRDKGIENKQTMTSCALSSLSTAITILLSSGYKNHELFRTLMDTARTLSDIQYNDSVLRRFFILSTVKKDLKDQLEKTKIDETLFGNNLPETLKSAKIISKSGADIKSASTVKLQALRPVNARTPNRPLNWRVPPAPRRPAAAGGSRPARPPPPPAPNPRPMMTTAPPRSGYKTSPRHPSARYRR